MVMMVSDDLREQPISSELKLIVLHTDLAEFTGANERLSLGKTANRIAARRLKNELVEMIDDV